MNSIILMGIKHCGKSTQGKLLSKQLNLPFFDTDDEVTLLTGKTPREIYTKSGKEAFIEAEKNACAKLAEKLSSENLTAVIATGGGICNNQDAVSVLKKIGRLVFLNSDEETACKRILREIKFDKDGTMSNLPAYIAKENPKDIEDVKNSFHNFYVERQKIYAGISDIEVKLEQSASKQENLQKILKMLGCS